MRFHSSVVLLVTANLLFLGATPKHTGLSNSMIVRTTTQDAMKPNTTKEAPPPAALKKPIGYMEANEPDFKLILPPPPESGSDADRSDVIAFYSWQRTEDTARWQLAMKDADAVYSRFAEAFGSSIDSDKTPLLLNLLKRTDRDMNNVATKAKDHFHRPRPYQRFQLQHVCGMENAPKADPTATIGTSYPSGHGSFAWTTATILAEVAPERAPIVLARGREFAESRFVCGAHFPSDITASQAMVENMLGRLHGVLEFQHDLSCAQQEHAVQLKAREQLSFDCQQLQVELQKKQK